MNDFTLSEHEDNFLQQNMRTIINIKMGNVIKEKAESVLQHAVITAETEMDSDNWYLEKSAVDDQIMSVRPEMDPDFQKRKTWVTTYGQSKMRCTKSILLYVLHTLLMFVNLQ